MADGVNSKYNLDALYKIVYPDGVENAIPDQTRVQVLVDKFRKIGESFKQPVVLTMPGGVTFGGIADMTDGAGGAYDLAEAILADTRKLTVSGYQITLRDVIGYGAAKAAMGGKESFKDAVGHNFESLGLFGRRLLEYQLLHGQSGKGMGVVASTSGAGPYVHVLTADSWAPGLWFGIKGHRICAYDRTTGAPNATNRGTTTTVTSVDFAARSVTVPGDLTGITGDDVIYRAGLKVSDGSTKVAEWSGTAWNTCLGMTQATQTTGTVWGIDNTGYDVIHGETQTASSTDLSFDVIGKAMGKLFIKGATGTFYCHVNPTTWANLISPEVAKARHDSSYNTAKVKVGNEAIEFYHITGKVIIEAHPFMREGEAYVWNPKFWERAGSTDLTFENDFGMGQKRIFLHLGTKNGFEIRAFSDQSPFTRRLGWTCLINNIVNS